MTTEAPQQTMTGSAGSAHAEQLLEMYRRMRRVRRFEERASVLYKATEIPGFLHLSIGQEASTVGVAGHWAPATESPPPTGGTATSWPRAWTRRP